MDYCNEHDSPCGEFVSSAMEHQDTLWTTMHHSDIYQIPVQGKVVNTSNAVVRYSMPMSDYSPLT